MPYVDWESTGGLDKQVQAKAAWFDGIPFMRNKVSPAIEEHLRQGGNDPSLIAFRVIGKERAEIFADSHGRTMIKFRQELDAWVQLELIRKFGMHDVESERSDDGHLTKHSLDKHQWPDLAKWVISTTRTQLKNKDHHATAGSIPQMPHRGLAVESGMTPNP